MAEKKRAGRPLRADAEANLARVRAAAEEVFAEHGTGASIELVARRAGLGLGTIYRRFPNKEALIADLANRLLADVVEIGERHLDDPAGTGLAAYMTEVSEMLAGSRGAVARIWGDPSSRELITRSRRVQQALVEDAQRNGTAREDLTGEDVAVALWGIHGILDVTKGQSVDVWRRHLEFVLAGFADRSARIERPAISKRSMTRVIRSRPGP